jgi:hypothetical protein
MRVGGNGEERERHCWRFERKIKRDALGGVLIMIH